MEIILLKDVLHCGFKDDVVKVKNGYARNFLIPKGFAIMANESTKKILAENLKQRSHKEESLIKEAELKNYNEMINQGFFGVAIVSYGLQ